MRMPGPSISVKLLGPLLLACLWLGGCTAMLIGDGGQRAAATAGSDAAIESAVRSRLAAAPGVDATAIEVRSRGATVTLSGEVESYGERREAGRLAASVSGVAAIDNRLAVVGHR